MPEPVPYVDDIEEALLHLVEAKVCALMQDEKGTRLSLQAVDALVRSAQSKLTVPKSDFPFPMDDGTAADIVDPQL